MKIKEMIPIIEGNTEFSSRTIGNVFRQMGYSPNNSSEELSESLIDIANHGADGGVRGFSYFEDTVDFYKKNRTDIVKNMKYVAEYQIGEDIVSMIQNFGIFRNDDKPSSRDVKRALSGRYGNDEMLYDLYNVFAWYAVEEIARAWERYVEDEGYNEDFEDDEIE